MDVTESSTKFRFVRGNFDGVDVDGDDEDDGDDGDDERKSLKLIRSFDEDYGGDDGDGDDDGG